MSLSEVFDDLGDVFFSTDLFGSTVTYIPQGLSENQFEVDANVDFANEEGSNQNRGEGRGSLNRDRGRTTQMSPTITFPTNRKLADGSRTPMVISENGKDRVLVKFPGTTRKVKIAVRRVVKRDEVGITVLCAKSTEHVAQRGIKE